MAIYGQVRHGVYRLIKEWSELPAGQTDWVDLTGYDPLPKVGDQYAPLGSTPVAIVYVIEARSLWLKMTDAEQDALLDSTNATVIKLVRRMKEIGFIKATKTQLVTMAQGLVTLGIISSLARAKEIFSPK